VFATPAEAPCEGPGGVAKGLRASCSCRPGGGSCIGRGSEEGEEEGGGGGEEAECGGAGQDGWVGGAAGAVRQETPSSLGGELEEEGEEEEMSGRQRHLYETAFDCKVPNHSLRRECYSLRILNRVNLHN
jgi:hypothetical protein